MKFFLGAIALMIVTASLFADSLPTSGTGCGWTDTGGSGYDFKTSSGNQVVDAICSGCGNTTPMTLVGDSYLGDPETFGDPPQTGRATADFEPELDKNGDPTGNQEYTFTEADGTVHTGVLKEKKCPMDAGGSVPV